MKSQAVEVFDQPRQFGLAEFDVDNLGNALAAFENIDGVLYAARYAGENGWTSAYSIDTAAGEDSSGQALDIGPHGDAVVAWRRDTSLDNFDLWVSVFE